MLSHVQFSAEAEKETGTLSLVGFAILLSFGFGFALLLPQDTIVAIGSTTDVNDPIDNNNFIFVFIY